MQFSGKVIASPKYSRALRVGLFIQLIVLFLFALLLDGGRMLKIGLCVALGCWFITALIVARRPTAPTPLDLLFIRYGFILLLIPTV